MKTKRKTKKIVLIVAVVIVVLLVAALIFAGNFLFSFALDPDASFTMTDMFHRGNVEGIDDGPALAATPERQHWEDYTYAAYKWYDAGGQRVELARPDGIRVGTMFRQSGHKFAILFHGYTGHRSDMAAYAKKFYDMGYSVLTPDALAHGDSDGRYMGMGWLDIPDTLGWIDYIIGSDPEAEIVLHGVSMGGAQVMMAAGEPLPENVKCIVEDCGYSSVWDEFRLQLKNVFHMPAFPLLHVTSAVSKLRAGYSFGEASAVEQLKKATVPMLFIHGEEDTFVPFEMLDKVYEACASAEKEKLAVPMASHGASVNTAPDLYWDTVTGFVEKFVG